MVKRCPFINTISKVKNPISFQEDMIPVISNCIKKECTFYNQDGDNCIILEAVQALSSFISQANTIRMQLEQS